MPESKPQLPGADASGTSKEMEIKLLGVARSSLEELLEDYQDFLRVRDLPLWDKDSKEAKYVRKLADGTNVRIVNCDIENCILICGIFYFKRSRESGVRRGGLLVN
jgi:hypothetical protein